METDMDVFTEQELDDVLANELTKFMANMDELIDLYDAADICDRMAKKHAGPAHRNYKFVTGSRQEFLKMAEKEAVKNLNNTRRRIKIYGEALLLDDNNALARARYILSQED